MLPAGRQQRVDVARDGHIRDRAQREILERVDEQLSDERHRKAADDQRPDCKLVVGDGNEPWLKARRAAGADDHAVGQRDGPVVVAEIRETHVRLRSEAMVRGERHQEALLKKVVTADSGCILERLARVLVGDRQIELAGGDPRREPIGVPSSKVTLASGCTSRSRATAAGTKPASADGSAPMRNRVRRRSAEAASWAPAKRKRSAIASACSSRIAPSSVSRRPPGRRSRKACRARARAGRPDLRPTVGRARARGRP